MPTPPIFPTLEGTRAKFADEDATLARLIREAAIPEATRAAISARAEALVARIRGDSRPTLMESFLAEYGLSTREGVALMCLAEAMLRVPDRQTIDALIEDKIAPSEWGRHLGRAASPLVNASTWALMLTGRVLDDAPEGIAGTLRSAIRRLGEPVIRTAVARAMREMGRQFVLGQSIDAALDRARAREARGFTYSYDMLGETAMTAADAHRYAVAYEEAIRAIGKRAKGRAVDENSGISIKLSALHPRYERAQAARVMSELVPVVVRLARLARAAGIGLHVDAEEQARLSLSLEVIAAVLADPQLRGWDGLAVVVQAYGLRAAAVIDALHEMAVRHDIRLSIRLVKGAYWDSEMKLAQVEGMPGFPLFTSKTATDASYICLAQKLFALSDRIYPQFATHNAHTVAAILELAQGRPFEFQRLHGMGERLHDIVLRENNTRCRIYAPVGAHRDLLAYLVRRLLENGANSSFVHQIVNEAIPPAEIARDPFAALAQARPPAGLKHPSEIFGPRRRASAGFDLSDRAALAAIEAARAAPRLEARPLTLRPPSGPEVEIFNPASGEAIGRARLADAATVARVLEDARPWAAPPAERAATLRRAAELYEATHGEIFAILAREGGKTLPDAVSELREACDFLRYYAAEGEQVARPARGVIVAISPWNFPLAIFTGQIAAALMAGNAVLAKPAEATPAIATLAVSLLHRAGVPHATLQLVPGPGPEVGAALTGDPRVAGVVFTGSIATAQAINRKMAAHLAPGAPLIAETGGLNAMVVDSTALPEQAVRDIVASAFRSAGQRCSALRCLYVQRDVAPQLTTMLKGAMDQLRLGDPWEVSTDVGPVIDAKAQAAIGAYLAGNTNRILHQVVAPEGGWFIPPTLLQVSGIEELEREIFGPVLHLATFEAEALPQVIGAINGKGYGLTFGLHSRIDGRVQALAEALHVGNLYVNRNQIGAVVGSQPFGGEGLSGTGPKAGGPLYLPRFYAPEPAFAPGDGVAHTAFRAADPDAIQSALSARPGGATRGTQLMPGPTGELNRLAFHARQPLLCLGPGAETATAQAEAVRALGGEALEVPARLAPEALTRLQGFAGALWWRDAESAQVLAQALAAREGPILPLLTARPDRAHVLHERHLCVDTTAAGGNAALMAEQSG